MRPLRCVTVTRIVVCLDGLDPGYLDAVETPAWDRLAATGSAGTCRSAVPTLTNVNNVGLLTAAPPAVHGVTGNTLRDPETGEREYVRSADYRRADTWAEAAAGRGRSVALLFAKEKLRRLAGDGVDTALSVEDPPGRLEDAVGPAPDIYSGDASAWILDAARYVVETDAPDVVYVSTTDVVPHKHAPGERAADEWVRTLDERLGRLAEGNELVATADHGMNAKTRRVDLEAVLAAGHDAEVVRLIRDAHTYHHRNLGGAAYVHDGGDATAVVAGALRSVDGVDRVLGRREAAAEFDLPADGTGALLVLGDRQTVFGPVDGALHDDVALRSHGSVHERTVPWAATVDTDLENNWEAWTALTGEAGPD